MVMTSWRGGLWQIRKLYIGQADRPGVALEIVGQHNFVVVEVYRVHEDVDYRPLVGFVGDITAFEPGNPVNYFFFRQYTLLQFSLQYFYLNLGF